ncbi:MAG: hemolysin secretion protein D [Rickettsiales bacterium]|nr:hemolysin secretion protein D [Rickettsiales bacterium]
MTDDNKQHPDDEPEHVEAEPVHESDAVPVEGESDVPADSDAQPGEQADEQDESQSRAIVPHGMDGAVQKAQESMERAVDIFDRWSDVIAPRNKENNDSPDNLARKPIVFGMWIAFFVFVVFGLWAAFAPLNSAAIAPGKVVLDANRKTIQHLEGGIVEDILVGEGSKVEAGDTLIVLDDTAAKARFDLYSGQYINARATAARLIAERDNAEKIDFPKELLEAEETDADIAQILDAQRRLFASRIESIDGQMKVLDQQIAQLDEEIGGLEQQITSSNEQIALLEEEIETVRTLLEKGIANKPRLLALERNAAELRGRRGEYQARISRAEQTISQARIEKYNLKTQFLNEVIQELRDTQSKMSDLEEQLRAAQDVVQRIEVKAPIAGEITGLVVHTKGGVITAGQKLMDIVPFDDKLIVEVRVNPQDIDVVRPGLEAQVRLTAYKVRNVPPAVGEVIQVSADRFEDERTGQGYFLARIAISPEELERLGHLELSPGMPAEALIVTGKRTLLSYLMDPISDSFNKAFREQ